MNTKEKIALGSLILGLIVSAILIIQTLMRLEIESPIAFHIRLLYFICYLLFILILIIIFKVFINGKDKEKSKTKRKLNKPKKRNK